MRKENGATRRASERKTWHSLPAAMRETKCSRTTLLSLGITGELELAPFGGRIFVSAASIAAFVARRGTAAA
jgi:hypothetical protein